MSTARIVLLAAVGLLVLTGSAFGLTEALHEQRDVRTVIGGRVHRIVVIADVGNVDVRAGLTANVVVDRRDTWLLERPEVRQRFARGTLRIVTGCDGLRSLLRCRTDLRIAAPPEVDVVVATRAGDVDLRGLNGRADVSTDSGDIRAHRLETVTVRAATQAGRVSLDLFGQPARAEARSGAGDVLVVVPYGPYRVDAQARAGDVHVQGLIRDDLAPQAIDAVADAGDITIRAR